MLPVLSCPFIVTFFPTLTGLPPPVPTPDHVYRSDVLRPPNVEVKGDGL